MKSYFRWQKIPSYAAGGMIGLVALIILSLNLAGMEYNLPPDIICSIDCYSKIEVNSTYWEIKVEHSGNQPVMYKKVSTSRTLWVNLDKINNIIPTDPPVEVEILVPTNRRAWATVDHEEFGLLRPLKDGDALIKRQNQRYNPNGDWFVIHGTKLPYQTVKAGFELASGLSEDIIIDPKWEAPFSRGTFIVDLREPELHGSVNGNVMNFTFGKQKTDITITKLYLNGNYINLPKDLSNDLPTDMSAFSTNLTKNNKNARNDLQSFKYGYDFRFTRPANFEIGILINISMNREYPISVVNNSIENAFFKYDFNDAVSTGWTVDLTENNNNYGVLIRKSFLAGDNLINIDPQVIADAGDPNARGEVFAPQGWSIFNESGQTWIFYGDRGNLLRNFTNSSDLSTWADPVTFMEVFSFARGGQWFDFRGLFIGSGTITAAPDDQIRYRNMTTDGILGTIFDSNIGRIDGMGANFPVSLEDEIGIGTCDFAGPCFPSYEFLDSSFLQIFFLEIIGIHDCDKKIFHVLKRYILNYIFSYTKRFRK